MSLLESNLKNLEQDLVANPARISAYHDLPFAIFRYDPGEEFELRKQLRLFSFGLEQDHGKHVRFISLARLVWNIVSASKELKELYEGEKSRSSKPRGDHGHAMLDGEIW